MIWIFFVKFLVMFEDWGIKELLIIVGWYKLLVIYVDFWVLIFVDIN